MKKKSKKSDMPEKSLEELEKEMKDKLDAKYQSDPRFKKVVDDLMAGKTFE